MPLEKVLGLVHPRTRDGTVEDKRTWRGGGASRAGTAKDHVWTAMDVLEAYAEKKGWITAQAGRPDTNRAGNASEYVLCADNCVSLREAYSFTLDSGGQDRVGISAAGNRCEYDHQLGREGHMDPSRGRGSR